jgi:hypothetical protein
MEKLIEALSGRILGHLPIGITIIDAETFTIIAQNDMVTEHFGQCVNKACYNALMSRPTKCPPCRAAQAVETNKTITETLHTPAGAPVLVTWIPLYHEGARYIIETLILMNQSAATAA